MGAHVGLLKQTWKRYQRFTGKNKNTESNRNLQPGLKLKRQGRLLGFINQRPSVSSIFTTSANGQVVCKELPDATNAKWKYVGFT